MPLVHRRDTISRLLEPCDLAARRRFYNETWNTRRWRVLFHLFFSRAVMGALGRDPSFFRYVEGSVAERILARTRHALTELEPSNNPYLQWILRGRYHTALPFYLREENVASVRCNLDRIEWHLAPLEDFLSRRGARNLSKFNLSDIFEYLSAENTETLLRKIAASARPGARLAYWNMLAPRYAPDALRDRIRPLSELAGQLHLRDKAFFYSAFIVEEIR